MHFALRDMIAQLRELPLNRAANTAKLLGRLLVKVIKPILPIHDNPPCQAPRFPIYPRILIGRFLVQGAMPPTLLKVVSWHELHQRAVFFWQVAFVALLEGGAAPARAFAQALCAEQKAPGLRDGAFLFVTRHLRPLVKASHQKLSEALEEVEQVLR